MTRASQRGFTLIELMIVIAIIGILAGIMVPNFTKARAEANLSACIENQKNIVTACQMYIAKHGLPDERLMDDAVEELLTEGEYPYLKKIPTCPAGGTYRIFIESKTSDKTSDGECYCVCNGGVHKAAGGGGQGGPRVSANGKISLTS